MTQIAKALTAPTSILHPARRHLVPFVLAALVATAAFVIQASPAQSAPPPDPVNSDPAAEGTSAPASAQGHIIRLGYHCETSYFPWARACVWVNWDTSLRVFRAHAHIEDVSSFGFANEVAVSSLRFCSNSGCTTYTDYDRWHPVQDGAISNLGTCGPTRLVYVSANFGTLANTGSALEEKRLDLTSPGAIVC
jgi:hypothetical protein